MEEKIDKAIDVLLSQVRTNLTPDLALKQSQAVLNLMHARAVWLGATNGNQPEGRRPKASN